MIRAIRRPRTYWRIWLFNVSAIAFLLLGIALLVITPSRIGTITGKAKAFNYPSLVSIRPLPDLQSDLENEMCPIALPNTSPEIAIVSYRAQDNRSAAAGSSISRPEEI